MLRTAESRRRPGWATMLLRLSGIWAGAMLGLGGAAFGQSLNETISTAYQMNPALDAQRARLRATDENIPQARAGFLPTISATGARGVTNTQSTNSQNVTVVSPQNTVSSGNGESRSTNYAITLKQPVFSGFRTYNAVNQAEAETRAGQETLRDVEQTVLLAAVTAHMDVVINRRLVLLAERNLALLTKLLGVTGKRFQDSDVTTTDVQQARSRRAGAMVVLESARASYKSSRARYQEVVGIVPSNLEVPPLPKRLLPSTLDMAIEATLAENPVVGAAYFREMAAQYPVKIIRGEQLPDVAINGSYSEDNISGVGAGRTRTAEVEARMTIPIFEGGLIHSRVRQAKEVLVSLQQELKQTRNQAKQRTTSAWSIFKANESQLQARRVQLRSAELALSGIRQEEALGQRTIANVLDSQQEAVNAEAGLRGAEHDTLVNAYALLAAIGRLTIKQLEIEQHVYDATAHADQVRHQIWGTTTVTYGDGNSDPDAARTPR